MKNLVIKSLEMLTGVVFFFIAIAPAVGGYAAGLVMARAYGLGQGASGVMGAVIGLGVGIILAVLFTGLIYVLLSINEKVGEIKGQLHLSKTPLP